MRVRAPCVMQNAYNKCKKKKKERNLVRNLTDINYIIRHT